MRYDETERLGVLAAENVFVKELRWIFREQPLVDVGIDAFAEKCDDGTPSGKFMALQVKSGEGNFYVKPDQLTYYPSTIHRNYWLNLNVPIVLIAYIPAEDKCYWQEISDRKISKTKKGWKINIPKANVLNEKAKGQFENILTEIQTKDIFSNIYEVEVDVSFEPYEPLVESLVHSGNIYRIIVEFGASFRKSKAECDILISKGNNLNSSPLKKALKQQSRKIIARSSKLTVEAALFSKTFPSELFTLEKHLYSSLKRTGSVPEPLINEIKLMPQKLETALKGIDVFRETVHELQNNVFPIRKALSDLANSLEHLCTEYHAALELTRNLNQ